MSAMTNNEWRTPVTLGKTGLRVSRIGLASSYGVGADGVQEAYEEFGINYFYWGSYRRESFGEGIRRLAQAKREDLVVVVQSYSRLAGLLASSLERALRRLKLDYADIFLLGFYSRPPSRRIMDAAMRLRDQGKARFIAVSGHRRPTFQQYIRDGIFDMVMFRYSAAHRGAETDILPYLESTDRPGTVAYTSTRWGQLLDPGKVPSGEAVPRAADCYRFVLSQPQIDVCLSGPADVGQMREGLAALARGPMSEDELAWMRRVGDSLHRRSPTRK
jgi:aryl-alcohol dehydrogenase-like predicted oxidoreductase